jgi:23S rRNA-/tRNA-specific pseudouridylate synthase
LAELGTESSSLADGRVFIARERVLPGALDRELRVGEEVFVFASRETSEVEILAQRSGLLAVLKPAGISTQPDQRGKSASLLGHLAALTGEKLETFHALHRLDREVSGIVLVAQGKHGLGIVEAARSGGGFRRRYVAIASAIPKPSLGSWKGAVGRGMRPGLRSLDGRDAKPACTRYSMLAAYENPALTAALMICEPITGRTHQIRVHAATAGAPLIGDRDYGGIRRITAKNGVVSEVGRVALHATLVELETPRIGLFRVEARVTADFGELWQLLGGNLTDFDATIAAPWLS